MGKCLDERGEIDIALGRFLIALFWAIGGMILGCLFVLEDALSASKFGDLILLRGVLWGFVAGFLFYYLISSVLDYFWPRRSKVDLDSMLFRGDGTLRKSDEIRALPEFKMITEKERKILIAKLKFLTK